MEEARSAGTQAAYQAAALATTLAIALAGGTVTGRASYVTEFARACILNGALHLLCHSGFSFMAPTANIIYKSLT